MRAQVSIMKKVIAPRLWLTVTLTAIVSCSLALNGYAQSEGETVPDRGFHPASSYALGNIETINTTNGNLMLNIPLAQLPAGRGGHPGFQLVLRYNSKIWDGQPDLVENPLNPNQMIDVTWLTHSDEGGWGYNLHRYQWSLYNRNSGGVEYPSPDCRHFNIWKMKVSFPDGSMREFRPYGIDDQCDDNYFTVMPAANRSYHSIDGTYARLDFGASTSDWTLYFADGTRVVNLPNGAQRTYDRNGNYTEITWVSNYNNTGHTADVVTDQLGRTIVVEYGANEHYIYVAGVNGVTLTTTVKWSSTYVNKTYRAGNHFQYDVHMDNWGVGGVSEIVLPSQLGSNLKFTFGYNGWATSNNSTPSIGWGELSSVTLPSGARADYQYDMDNTSGTLVQANWVLKNSPTRKDLNYNREYDGTSTPAPTETWLYSIGDGFAQVTGPDGGITKEYFGDIDSQIWNSGLVHKIERPDGSVIERIWKQNRPFLPPGVTIWGGVGVNTFVEKEFTSIRNAAGALSQTAIKEYRRDKNGNLTQLSEYDWVSYASVPRDSFGPTGIPAGAPLKRRTITTYHAATPDANSGAYDPDTYDETSAPRLLTAPASNEVGNGVQTLSRSEFLYDNAFTTGNLTQQKNWDSVKGGYSNPLTAGNSISVSHQYDSFGSRTLSTDARGFQIKMIYGSVGSFTDLYPTDVIKAFGTTSQRTQTLEYDFSTGLIKRITDVDNSVVQEMDFDALGRVTEVRSAANVADVKSVTRTEYSAANRRIITRADLDVAYDGKLVSIQHYDQLGRIRLVRQLEDAATQDPTDETAGVKVQTRYAFSGSNSFMVASNPYRAATSSAASGESTMGWTRTKNDNVGRVLEVQSFAGSSLPAPWDNNTVGTGAIVSAYDANFTTVTEQTAAQPFRTRRTMTDGLSQLVRVDEPGNDYNLGAVDNPVQPTSYSFDALGNLVTVNQGSQTRSFVYSSLSRLLTATNPENGTINYQYDNNGNLKQKTDARSVVTTFGTYDPLNRPTTKSYSDGTPTVTYSYDSTAVQYSKGRLTSLSSSVSTFTFTSYDALGRGKAASLALGGQTYTMSYTYDLAGHIKTITYPSNRSVTYSYDSAGRMNSVAGSLGDSVQRTYSSGIIYGSDGQMTQEQLGTTIPVYNKLFYNSRGQLAEIRNSTTPNNTSWNRGAIINNYSDYCSGICSGSQMPDNNGNLRKQEIYIPNDDNITTYDQYAQTYQYDSLNRLQSVSENKFGGSNNWQQSYSYDRFGNRSINGGGTFGQNINNNQASVVANTPSNRIYAPGETEQNHPLINYDPSGNQIKDYYSVSGFNYDRLYDGDNRMTSSTASGSFGTQVSTYAYDGNGQRVRRNVNGVETWQVYGIGGQLLAEYAANAPASSPQKEFGYRRGQLLITAAAGAASAPAPTSLTANPSGGGATVTVSWSSASGATNYRVERKAAGGSFGLAATTASTSIVDNGVSAGNAYLYRVCSANGSGNCTSAYSNIALGAAVAFPTNPTITSIVDDPTGVTVTQMKAAHITELRSAVNAVRSLAGLSAATWTNPTLTPTSTVIKADDVRDLRNRLDEALVALGIQTSAYDDNSLAGAPNGTVIKKTHITQLRLRSTSGVGGAGGGGGALPDIRWLITDQLGTPRMIFDQSGSLSGVTRHDYLPYGEELIAGTNGRSSQQGYSSSDNVRQKFTEKERDEETKLDFFGARYHSSLLGRFTSTDPIYFEFMMALDPQRFNLYSYARNNPLKWIDPSGERVYLRGDLDWLRNNILYEMVGGKEEFDKYFDIKDGQVVIREGVDPSQGNAGVQQLASLVNASQNYLYFAGTDGNAVADLFQGTKNDKGKLTDQGKRVTKFFTCDGYATGCGTQVGTLGRPTANQPANLASGDPVFAVIAYNTNTVITQESTNYGSLNPVPDDVKAAQTAGVGQLVRPVSFFIHESTENQKFAEQGAGKMDYPSAHAHAIVREAALKNALSITGGFAGAQLRTTIPKKK
jgi:RHS repeat-associated protein